jgi:release factor glutamine methyltransferase
MKPKTWTIKDLLRVTATYLGEKGVDNPRLDSEVLLAHHLKKDRMALYLEFDQPLTQEEISGYRGLIKRRVRREPLQYITGTQEFWSLDFSVDRRVLIPRPETEVLVEMAVERLKEIPLSKDHFPKFLDMGTGCGAIAVSLAREVQDARIWATDISDKALEVARFNAKKHGVLDRIQFRRGDLWEAVEGENTPFDIILSNPPYVASEEYRDLPPEVRDYEPRLALDGKEGGMHYLFGIASAAPRYLKPGGWILLEMAPPQTEKTLSLIKRVGGYGKALRVKDYGRLYRVVAAQKSGQGTSAPEP